MNRWRWFNLLDLFFPRCCALCTCALGDETTDPLSLCVPCRTGLTVHAGRLCPRCGAPLGPFVPESEDCHHCRRDRFAFEGVVALGEHGGGLRMACLRGKRPAGSPALAAMSELLWRQHGETLRSFAPDLVLPVPQHWRTRILNAHNPAEVIGGELARRLGTLFGHRGLRKVRRTLRQATLPATERRTNLKGAFRADVPAAVRGARILLVDDVLTTGSTANECAKALKAAGADRIFVAVLTRGLG